MRFERLGLERFGQFESLNLDLAGADLVIVHGPNEAGKSTLLRAIHGLLFGIDERSPDNFRFPYPAMHLTASLRDGAGQRIELSRRKKRKDALLGTLRTDLGELALDEPRFARYFGIVTEDLYRQIFGFHHDDLQRGADILNVAGLGELLGGGALGGSAESLRRVLTDLHDEADDLYKERGKNPPVNRALTSLADTRAALRDATLQQPQYLALTTNLKNSRETLAEADAELARLRQRAARIDTLLLAFEDFHEHQRLTLRLADPDLASPLAHADAARVAPLLAELHALTQRCQSLADELDRLERRAAHHPVDQALLAEAATIERLLRRVETVAAQRHDLPRTHARLTRERADLLAQLIRLSPGTSSLSVGTSAETPPSDPSAAPPAVDLSPGTSAVTSQSALRPVFAPISPAELEAIRLAVARWQRSRQELAVLARAHADDAAELAALTATADALTAQLPDEQGRDLLAELEHRQSQHAELERLDLELARKAADLELSLARLHPRPTGDPERLPLPAAAAVQDLNNRRHELDADRREAQHELSRQTAELSRLDAELAALADHDLPDPASLESARARRDDTWSLVRQHLLAPRADPQRDLFATAEPAAKRKPADLRADPKQLARAYERGVVEVDQLADRLRDAAEHLAQKTALDHTAARARLAVTAARARLTALERAEQTWQSAWHDLWRPLAVAPGTPAAMLAWLSDATAVRDLAAAHARRTRDAASLRPELAAFESRLRTHLAAAGAWPVLVHQLRARERTAEHLRGRLESTQAQISALRTALARAAATRDLLGRDHTAATADLRRRTTALGLPADIDPETALRHLDALTDLADRLADVDRQLATTSQSLAALADFDAEVAALRARLTPVPEDTSRTLTPSAHLTPVPEDTSQSPPRTPALTPVPEDTSRTTPPEHIVELLGRTLADARAAATAQAHARDESAERRREQTRISAALAALHSETAALRARAGAPDDTALAELADRALHRHTLTRTQGDLELRLARLLGDGEPRAAYAAELQTTRREALRSERQALASQLADLDHRRLTAVEQRGRLEHEAQQLGGDRAARLGAEYEVIKSDLEDHADRYVLLHLAERVLSRVADRYARDNQPAILQYTSDLLTRITAGRHVRAVVQPEARTLALLGRDGQLRQPADLSSGTREQLFLALRLAYVLDYCDRCEPLPVVMDDVLVNFDDTRAAAALAALRDLGRSTQVVLLTCHRRWLDLAPSAAPDARILELPAEPSPALALHGPGRAAEA